MRMTKLALSLLLAGIGTGCTGVPPAPFLSISELPNCFDTNYDRERVSFMIKTDIGNAVESTVLAYRGPSADAASASRLRAGSYRAYFPMAAAAAPADLCRASTVAAAEAAAAAARAPRKRRRSSI